MKSPKIPGSTHHSGKGCFRAEPVNIDRSYLVREIETETPSVNVTEEGIFMKFLGNPEG
jgi:hypothetical protein